MVNLDINYARTIKEESLSKTREQKVNGQKVVGVYCAFTPRELIIAAGGIPVSLCGSSDVPIPLAERHLPRNMCPLIKSSYGYALGNTCPFFDLADILIADATCDGKKKMFELLDKIKPIYVLQLPSTADGENALTTWIQELNKLKAHLEKELGTEITEDSLVSAIGYIINIEGQNRIFLS
ncbi:hypothetical protein N752_13030 [Desulforamulus aquiferis]|nr:hypothetical protein N752_13030 [Desulforamulus aquiferis]